MSAVLTHSPAAFNSQVRCRKLVFCLPKTFSCGVFCSQRHYTTRIALVQINFKQLLILSVALPNTHFFRKTALKGRLWYCGHFRPSHFSTTLYKTDDSILHKAGTQNTTSPQQSNNLASLPSFSSLRLCFYKAQRYIPSHSNLSYLSNSIYLMSGKLHYVRPFKSIAVI